MAVVDEGGGCVEFVGQGVQRGVEARGVGLGLGPAADGGGGGEVGPMRVDAEEFGGVAEGSAVGRRSGRGRLRRCAVAL